jgi:hypothetical protein
MPLSLFVVEIVSVMRAVPASIRCVWQVAAEGVRPSAAALMNAQEDLARQVP